jgi:hypothetical protein
MHCRICPTPRSYQNQASPGRRRSCEPDDLPWPPPCSRCRGRRQCAATRSATPSSMCCSRTIPTSTGALAGAGVLNQAQERLPEVLPHPGPDATGVGWIYQYALVESQAASMILPSCGHCRTGSEVQFQEPAQRSRSGHPRRHGQAIQCCSIPRSWWLMG